MALNLKLDFVGTQARSFGGQFLGLPVIGLPNKKHSNLTPLVHVVQEKVEKKVVNASTQVHVAEVFNSWDKKNRNECSKENELKMTINSNLLDESSNNPQKADTLKYESGRKDSEMQDSSPEVKLRMFEFDESYLSSINNKIHQKREIKKLLPLK